MGGGGWGEGVANNVHVAAALVLRLALLTSYSE